MTELNWELLIAERDEWIEHNFPNPHIDNPGESVMGIVEEIGELTHARLKAAQNIRGDEATHRSAAIDAVGDITIYALGIMSFCDCIPDPDQAAATTKPTTFSMAASAGAMSFIYDNQMSRIRYRQHLNNLIVALRGFCEKEGLGNYELIVVQTWQRVKQRDWIEDPTTGGEKS